VLLLAADSVVLSIAGFDRRAAGHDAAIRAAHRFAFSAGGVIAIGATNASVLLLVSLVAARLLGGMRERLRMGASRATVVGLVAAVVGTIGLSVAGGAASELLRLGHGGVTEMIGSALAGAAPATLVAALAAIAAAPGIAEETFFRGLMQTRLAASWGRWPAIVTASLAFGLLHLDMVQSSFAFVVGLFLGWCAERFGGIRPTIIAHSMNNAVFVLLATARRQGDMGRASQLIAVVVGVAVCALCAAVLRGRSAVADRSGDDLCR
jgi:membrane protease YdiL (CAAX protease family)